MLLSEVILYYTTHVPSLCTMYVKLHRVSFLSNLLAPIEKTQASRSVTCSSMQLNCRRWSVQPPKRGLGLRGRNQSYPFPNIKQCPVCCTAASPLTDRHVAPSVILRVSPRLLNYARLLIGSSGRRCWLVFFFPECFWYI